MDINLKKNEDPGYNHAKMKINIFSYKISALLLNGRKPKTKDLLLSLSFLLRVSWLSFGSFSLLPLPFFSKKNYSLFYQKKKNFPLSSRSSSLFPFSSSPFYSSFSRLSAFSQLSTFKKISKKKKNPPLEEAKPFSFYFLSLYLPFCSERAPLSIYPLVHLGQPTSELVPISR